MIQTAVYPAPVRPTKDRILDAAEELFAAHGFAGASLRAVTRAADVNLAAVHYHFGSKARLFEAIFQRRAEALAAEHRARLEELTARSSSPAVEELARALLEPVLELAGGPDPGQRRFLRLAGRLQVTGAGEQAPRRVFDEALEHFAPAFASALPELTATDLRWRLGFLVGSLCAALCAPQHEEGFEHGELLDQLVAFATSGLGAPAA